MGDDAELYIESGGDPTTLISDCWYNYGVRPNYYVESYDDEQQCYKKKNTMIFIDAESVAAHKCASIISQGKKAGELFEARYYALQNDASTAEWKSVAKEYDIKPILLYGEAQHNKVDDKIIKDIKKVLRTNKSIDIFCIASRDGDYADIVEYVRESGKRAVVLAGKNTSQRLRQVASEVKGI